MNEGKRLCGIVEDEMSRIAEKGLNTANLDTAYKLIDMYKDLKNCDYWEKKGEYYMTVLDEMQGGNSYSMAMDEDGHSMRRHRDSMGRYARNDGYDRRNSYGYDRRGYSMDGGDDDYNRYMESKRSYRSGDKSSDCKQRMISALERHLDKLTDEINEMGKDADCAEERDTIMRYVDKLKRMM